MRRRRREEEEEKRKRKRKRKRERERKSVFAFFRSPSPFLFFFSFLFSPPFSFEGSAETEKRTSVIYSNCVSLSLVFSYSESKEERSFVCVGVRVCAWVCVWGVRKFLRG